VGGLDLETPRLSPSSGSLELPSLAGDVRLAALEGSTKVLDGLSDVPLSSEEDGVGSGRGSDGELVEGQGLTAGGNNSLSGRGGEFEGGDRELGDLGKSLVVEDGADNDNGLRVVRVGASGLLDNSGEGDGGSVDLPSAPCTSSEPACRLTFDMKSRRRMTRLNRESVRRARKR